MATVSSGLWASRGVAAPGAILGERPGGCREQATRALPADAAPEPAAPATSITGAQRHAGLDAWLGGLARDTGIFSRICRTPRRNIPCNPRCLPAARRQQDRKSQRLPRPPHTTPIRGRLGRCRRQVIQVPAGCAAPAAGPRSARPSPRVTSPRRAATRSRARSFSRHSPQLVQLNTNPERRRAAREPPACVRGLGYLGLCVRYARP